MQYSAALVRTKVLMRLESLAALTSVKAYSSLEDFISLTFMVSSFISIRRSICSFPLDRREEMFGWTPTISDALLICPEWFRHSISNDNPAQALPHPMLLEKSFHYPVICKLLLMR